MEYRNVSRVKSGHTYVFRCEPRAEADLLDAVMDQAEDRNCPLDWLDAAAIGFEVARSVAESGSGMPVASQANQQ